MTGYDPILLSIYLELIICPLFIVNRSPKIYFLKFESFKSEYKKSKYLLINDSILIFTFLILFMTFSIGSIMSIYKLYELVNIYKGSNLITKKYIEQNEGIYPVISSKTTENGVYGFINTYDYEKDKITMSSDGENAGTTFWQEKNFSLTNHALVFIMNKLIKYNYKYLFLTLKKHESKIKELIISGSTRPSVSLSLLKSINIKLPSIEEQNAIIDIIEQVITCSIFYY
ncbi:restriction endonuclease MpuUVI subunit S [Ureaplasma parvum serovar 3]|nr:restriction endonuclease MpuUVI subunit S [Ureaplasma parvum serovar 3]